MKSASKLFSILETLCLSGDCGISELSKKLGFGKSMVHRFLSVLRDLGYVEKNTKNNRYFATLKIFEIGAMVRGRISLVNITRSYMEELGKMFHETVNLAFFEEGEVVYVDKVESVEALRMDLAIGRRVPAYCTALGKVFLANLQDEEFERYCRSKNFKAFTEKTITSVRELRKNLAMVKTKGVAIDDRELDSGIRCIASPIKDQSGKVVAAISIAGPSTRMTNERLGLMEKPIIRVTREISKKLGYAMKGN